MPLFDPLEPRSEEPAALYRCRELVAATEAAQELLEVESNEDAEALIFPGPPEPPLDGESYTIAELEGKIAWGHIRPATEQDSLLVSRSLAVGAISEKEGYFCLHFHRQIREVEYNAANGRWDCYLYFMDVTGAICEQLVEAADLNLAVSQVKRLRGPFFNPQTDWPAQGKFLWADFIIAWGGSERAE